MSFIIIRGLSEEPAYRIPPSRISRDLFVNIAA